MREQLTEAGHIPALRADISKRKALEWLTETVTIVDEDGNAVSLRRPRPRRGRRGRRRRSPTPTTPSDSTDTAEAAEASTPSDEGESE